MFYALKDKHGQYISKNSTLSGRNIHVVYTDDIYNARLDTSEYGIKRDRTIVNKRIGQPSGAWYSPNAKPIEEVDIIKLELKEIP